MKSEERQKYRSKAKDSFKTKKNLFVFSLAIDSKHRFTLKEFDSFRITEGLVEQYSTQYWQQHKDHKIQNLTIEEIEENIKTILAGNSELFSTCESIYIENFPTIFSEKQFIQLIIEDRKKGCHYCHITEDKIDELGRKLKLNKKSFRGWSLEIDRLNSNFEYTKDNCVMACYWCNNAKTDEFTEEEFLMVGEVIKQIWEERLK